MKTVLLLLMCGLSVNAMDLNEIKWRIVNDSVMGGISESAMQPVEGAMRFAGILSLENNGGFASVRSREIDPLPRTVTEIVIKVKGDGRTYDFDLRDGVRRRAFSYRQRFETTAGEVTEVRLPIGAFTATSFGRVIPGAAPIRPENIRSVGITLADKKPGPFRIDLISINAVEGELSEQPLLSSVELIDQAISFGVPQYNHGNHSACAMIYEMTLNSFLIKDHPEMSEDMQNSLRIAMASLPMDMDDRAWALRRELDQLRNSLRP